MSEFKTILLDIDDTLLDFRACEREALSQTFHKYGLELNEEIRSTYEQINKSLWKQYELGEIDKNTVIYSRFVKLFEQLGYHSDGVTFEDDYQWLLGQQFFLLDDALEVIQYLHSKYDLYIVTNGVTETQKSRIELAKIDQYMKGIFISEATGYQKPMKEFFDYCFERIENLELNKTIIIGDSLSSDMKGGNNAGITTCWFNPKHVINNLGVKVDYEIQSLKELNHIL